MSLTVKFKPRAKPEKVEEFRKKYKVVYDDPIVVKDEHEFYYKLSGKVTFGNKKLPASTAIFNMNSGWDCPSKKLGLCEVVNNGATCYAIKAEELRATVLPYRRRQEIYWDKVTAEDFVERFLNLVKNEMVIDGEKVRIKQLRISEAGDFKSQADVNKMDKACGILKANGIRCYVYSARKDLNFKNVKNMNVNGSNFMGSNQFKAVPILPDKLKENEKICPGSCRECNLCAGARGKTIYVKYH